LVPIAGDWDNDGRDTIGLYDGSTSTFYLKNSLSGGKADVKFGFGAAGAGWLPIAGDWNGKGSDAIGLYSGANSTFYLKNTLSGGKADLKFMYGAPGAGWQPVAGVWTAQAGTLLAAGGATNSDAANALSKSELHAITNEAIRRWQSVGVDTEARAKLEAARIVIADLRGSQLAAIDGDTIVLDSTAAGHGWFVDSTPTSDEEYATISASTAMTAKSSTAAVDHIDLLTVVEQELGKVAGLEDLTDCVVHNKIGTGVRSSILAAS
jgi:hypothetical protein